MITIPDSGRKHEPTRFRERSLKKRKLHKLILQRRSSYTCEKKNNKELVEIEEGKLNEVLAKKTIRLDTKMVRNGEI